MLNIIFKTYNSQVQLWQAGGENGIKFIGDFRLKRTQYILCCYSRYH